MGMCFVYTVMCVLYILSTCVLSTFLRWFVSAVIVGIRVLLILTHMFAYIDICVFGSYGHACIVYINVCVLFMLTGVLFTLHT